MLPRNEVHMLASKVRWVVLTALVGACAPFASGCYASVQEEPVVVEGYRPMYYNGYVVYYDQVGAPYYYYNGGVAYIPRTYGGYGVYVNHYNTYRGAYYRWNAGYGARYRTYYRRR